jgi:hypothetical protein
MVPIVAAADHILCSWYYDGEEETMDSSDLTASTATLGSEVGFPRTIEELTPAWLSSVLASTVLSVESEIVGAGVGFLGQLARLTLGYGGDDAGMPRSLIAKLSTPDIATRQFVAMYGLYRSEVNFYQKIASSVSIRTPTCYFAAISHDGTQCLLLLEDLGNSGRVGDQAAGCTLDHAGLAIDHLATFHAAWWASKKLGEMDWLPVGLDQARGVFVTTYPIGWRACIERYGYLLPQSIVDAAPTLNERALSMLDSLASSPLTTSHGDFRLDNMFFGTEGGAYEFALIDWQLVNRGVGAYDLGYFLITNLDIDDRRRAQAGFLDRYHHELVQHGVRGYSLEQCRQDYRRSALMLLGIEIAAAMNIDPANERGLASFEKIFKRAAAAAIDLDALSL